MVTSLKPNLENYMKEYSKEDHRLLIDAEYDRRVAQTKGDRTAYENANNKLAKLKKHLSEKYEDTDTPATIDPATTTSTTTDTVNVENENGSGGGNGNGGNSEAESEDDRFKGYRKAFLIFAGVVGLIFAGLFLWTGYLNSKVNDASDISNKVTGITNDVKSIGLVAAKQGEAINGLTKSLEGVVDAASLNKKETFDRLSEIDKKITALKDCNCGEKAVKPAARKDKKTVKPAVRKPVEIPVVAKPIAPVVIQPQAISPLPVVTPAALISAPKVEVDCKPNCVPTIGILKLAPDRKARICGVEVLKSSADKTVVARLQLDEDPKHPGKIRIAKVLSFEGSATQVEVSLYPKSKDCDADQSVIYRNWSNIVEKFKLDPNCIPDMKQGTTTSSSVLR